MHLINGIKKRMQSVCINGGMLAILFVFANDLQNKIAILFGGEPGDHLTFATLVGLAELPGGAEGGARIQRVFLAGSTRLNPFSVPFFPRQT